MNNTKLIEPGKWCTTFDGNGKVVTTVYDESFRRLMGFGPENDDDNKAWSCSIHPDDADRIAAYFADCCSKHPEGMDYDIEYRMITKRGCRWFHDFAHFTREEDGTPIRADGVVFDIQDVVEKEDAHQRLTENYTRILALEDAFEVLYDVDLATGQYEIFVKGETFGDVNKTLINNNSFFDDVEKNLEVVHPDDRQGNYDVTRPEFIRKALSEDDHFDRYYRLLVNGEPAWARMRIVYKDTEKKNIIIGVFNAGNDVEARQIAEQKEQLEIQQKQLKEQLALSDGLAREYHTVWLVEGSGDHRMHLYRSTGKKTIRDAVQLGLDEPSYDASIIKYVREYVHEDDQKRVLEESNFETIERETPEVGTYVVTYRRYNPEHTAYDYHQMVYARAESEGGNLNYILAYRDADKTIREQLEKQARFEESTRIISSLSEDFGCVVYVEISENEDRDVSTNYRVSELLKKTIPGWEKETSFSRKVSLLLDYVVYSQDSERFRHDTSRAVVLEKLKDKDVYFTNFRLLIEGEVRYYQMKFSAVRVNGELVGVVSGLHSVDEQMRRELESRKKQKEAENAEKLVESVAGIYRFAFAVDMAGSYFKLIRMDDEVKNGLNASEFRTYQEAIAPLFGLVHPGDKVRMTHELKFDTIREKLKDTDSYNVVYRILNNGATEWHEMNVTHITGDEVALGFGEKDLEITKRHIEERRFNECFGLYETDLDTGLFKVIIDSPYYTFSETGDAVPYTATMTKFAESQVGETREFFLNLADPDWVSSILAEDNRHSFTYFSVTAENTWVDVTSYVTMRHDDGTPAMFALEFSFVSSAGAARQDMQRRLNESSHMISGLASGYVALYYINIDEGVFNVYTLDAQKFPEVNRIVSEGKDPFEMLRTYGASELVHPDDRHLFADMSAEVFRERLAGQKRFSIRFRKVVDGKFVWIEMDAFKYEGAEEQANALVVGFTDCDEEIKKEMEQQQRLEEALSLAESASKAKTEFLFNMSHDIRTPMNAILGYTNIALNHIYEPEKMNDSLKKIKTSGGHLLQLINDILEMSRIEAGKLEIVNTPLNIYDVSEGVINMSQALASTKDIAFNAKIGDLKNPFIYADELHTNQIIINLISNAIKYTNPGGTVDYRIEQISDAVDGMARYRVIVKDNGIGMSEEFQNHLFESFSREKSATISKQEGAGLGLAIVKSIVDLIGGTISAQSKQGEGSTFTVELPLRVMDSVAIEDYKAARNADTEIGEDLTLEGRRVLLVEDNEMNREIAVEILEETGLLIDTAEDGAAAVRKVTEKGLDYYDYVLMDIQMPVMNGYEATTEIRKLPDGDRIPIIALSANAFKEDIEKSLEAGMNAHVAKPINVKELLDTMHGLAKQR